MSMNTIQQFRSDGISYFSSLGAFQNVSCSSYILSLFSTQNKSHQTCSAPMVLDSACEKLTFLLCAVAALTGLTHLDLFGARITDSGTNCFRCR